MSTQQLRRAQGRSLVVTMPPEIDADNADRLRTELARAVASGAAIVIADLTRTSSCDSTGIGVLYEAHTEAAEHRIELRLVIPPADAVKQTLAYTGMEGVLRTYPTHAAARPPGEPATPVCVVSTRRSHRRAAQVHRQART